MHDDEPIERAADIGRGLLSWLAPSVEDAEERADGGRGNEDGTFSFVASTGSIDRMGDVVEQSWRLANFRRNPVILHEHAAPVIGRGTVKVDKESDALMLTVSFDDSEVNPIGRLVAHQHRQGFRGAVSVGFRAGRTIPRTKLPDDHPAKLDGDKVPEWASPRLYRSNELLEVSSVAIPANAEAIQLREYAAEAEDPEEQIRRYLREAAPSDLSALIGEFLRDCPAAVRHVRAAVLGVPTIPAPRGTDEDGDPLSFLY